MPIPTILYIILAAISVFSAGFSAAAFLVIKFNDISHMSKDLEEIKKDVKQILEGQQVLEVRLTKQETKCNERHSRKRKNV